MSAPPQGTGGHGTIIHRRIIGPKGIEHIFIACLEIKMKGNWDYDSALFYRAIDEKNEIHLIELNGTRKHIKFKKGAYVTVLSTNVLTYEGQDEDESVYTDEDEQSGKTKNETVID